ncbi:MAG: 2OG-Fe dioxygenase family protein [Thiotrichaceae bacterium]|nr:2OG-Fe dioxygenase family protein [Thiotrichaceae bacterium]
MFIKPRNELIQSMNEHGFLHVSRDAVLALEEEGEAFADFCCSWDKLPEDQYLKDQEHFRYRRYSVFEWVNQILLKSPTEPHYQTEEYNRVYGGVYRHYDAINDQETPLIENLAQWALQALDKMLGNWRIQCHQFRVCASQQEEGKPTPEGIHQDGADYVFIMLIGKENVRGGMSSVYRAPNENPIYVTMLAEQGELLLLDDRKYWHGVTNIEPEDGTKPAYRDVLVMTFHRKS